MAEPELSFNTSFTDITGGLEGLFGDSGSQRSSGRTSAESSTIAQNISDIFGSSFTDSQRDGFQTVDESGQSLSLGASLIDSILNSVSISGGTQLTNSQENALRTSIGSTFKDIQERGLSSTLNNAITSSTGARAGSFTSGESGSRSGVSGEVGTERLKLNQAAVNQIIQDVLGGAGGLAEIFGGEQTAGVFNSTAAAGAAGNLVSKLVGELAKVTAEKETTSIGTEAGAETTTAGGSQVESTNETGASSGASTTATETGTTETGTQITSEQLSSIVSEAVKEATGSISREENLSKELQLLKEDIAKLTQTTSSETEREQTQTTRNETQQQTSDTTGTQVTDQKTKSEDDGLLGIDTGDIIETAASGGLNVVADVLGFKEGTEGGGELGETASLSTKASGGKDKFLSDITGTLTKWFQEGVPFTEQQRRLNERVGRHNLTFKDDQVTSEEAIGAFQSSFS